VGTCAAPRNLRRLFLFQGARKKDVLTPKTYLMGLHVLDGACADSANHETRISTSDACVAVSRSFFFNAQGSYGGAIYPIRILEKIRIP